jgi:hypothetical protein
VALVAQDKYCYTTKMWALVDKNTKIVLGCITPTTYKKALQASNGNILIKMTLENSPASIGNLWNGERFIESEK